MIREKLFLPALIIFFLISRIVSFAQTNNQNVLQPHNVESFLDSVVTSIIDEQNLPGAGIAIVKGDSILFSKGYGYSNINKKTPVDPAKTIWRIASISKVVTGTAVLIARDDGLVDMNSDVNNYLKSFKVPATFEKPITLTHLLTHTPGFDDVYIGKSAHTKEEALAFSEFMKEYLPARIIPPGEVFNYSNMGNALAALAIQEVSGTDFEEYSAEKIFNPLEMKTTSFTLKEFQKENLYTGYFNENGNLIEFPFDHINDYPAGQMLTTLNEFTNFMIMHLNNGQFKEKEILDSSTVAEMHSVQFTHHPLLEGSMGYAFGIGETNGYKNLAHSGGYAGLATAMYLYPELDLGIIAAVNISSGAPHQIIYQFMDTFFPADENPDKNLFPLEQLPEYDADVEKFTGYYRGTRYTRNSITKIAVLIGMFGEEMPIWKNAEGMIVMFDHNGDERRLVQIEPQLFKSIDDDYHMAFRANNDDKITHLFTNGRSALEKIEWYERSGLNRILFFIITTIYLIVTSLFIVKSITQRKKENKSANYDFIKLSGKTGISYLLYFILFVLVMTFGLSSAEQQIGFAYGLPWYFYLLQIIPFFGIYYTIRLIIRCAGAVSILNKIKFGFTISLLTIFTSIVTIWFLNYWCLLGWRF